MQQEIGEGAFGHVLLAQDRAGGNVAIKLIPLGPRFQPRLVERELLNHLALNHPHIVQFIEVLLLQAHAQHGSTDFLAIVMEYVSGGNLHAYVRDRGSLPEPLCRWFFQQVG